MALLEELVEKGFLAQDQANVLKEETKTSGTREEELILAKGLVSEDVLFNLKSNYFKIPLREIKPEDVFLETLELIPEETARHYRMIPLLKKENTLEVGMVYPEDLDAQEALKFLSRRAKFNYKVFLISQTTFDEALKQYRNLKKEVGKALAELETELRAEKLAKSPLDELGRLVEDAPIAKVVAVVLRYAVEGRASDIHIEPAKDRLRVRFRMLGTLHSSIILPLKIHPAVVARIKILSNLKIDEARIPQDGRFSAKIDERDIDFRVSTFPTTLGEKVVIRVLDPTVGLKKFEDLGLSGRNFEVVKKAVQKPYGMILSTGPTGSGKTTTLYAMLQILNKEGVNIVTLEDPVEYFMEGINQSQVKPEIGYDFARGLRHILRQDPDIVMVGEIRDQETASLAVHAALTGHIVLSTLHTNNAAGAVPRLLDLKVQPFLIPPSLSIVIAQRLVGRLCDNCKQKVRAKKEIRYFIMETMSGIPEAAKKGIEIEKDLSVFEPKGCHECNNEGFSGRIGLFEALEMTGRLAEIILKEPSESKIEEEAKRQGMLTMKQDGILKALRGITTIEEVLRVAEDK